MTFEPSTAGTAEPDLTAVLRIVQDAMRDRVLALGPEVALTAALGPAWSPKLTELADLGIAAEVLLEIGLAEGDAHRRWWVPGPVGHQMTAWALDATGADSEAIIHIALARLSGAVHAAASEPVDTDDTGIDTPPAMARLGRIVGEDADDETAMAENLVGLVRASRNDSDALNYLDAASRLAEVSDVVASASMRGARIVEARSREQRREAFLRTYYRRPALHGHLERFAFGGPDPSDAWALHVMGSGGVGKSMLLRGLAAEFPADGSRGSIAIIDFDHLDPDYPTRKPALLLSALAAALEPFGRDGIDEARAGFDARAQDWTDRLSEAEISDPVLFASLRAERLGAIHDAFVRFLDLVPEPVVLVLDTCEELDKLSSATDDHVSALFGSLEAIVAGKPGVRVVLAGRRPLAGVGDGWALGPSAVVTRPVRPYLARLDVGPLSPEEAAEFVRFRGIDEPLASRVIDRAVGRDRRVNPFDLALLCNWATGAGPGDDPATVDLDRFLEHRILSRIGDLDVRDAVPAIALLRTFDAGSLGAVTATEGDRLTRLAVTLGAEEWVSTGLDGRHSVDANLADRLSSYYRRRHPALWAALRARAARHYAGVIDRAGAQLHASPTHEFVAALEFVDDAPAFWQRIEQAALDIGALVWLGNLAQEALRQVALGRPVEWWVRCTAAGIRQRDQPDLLGEWDYITRHAEPGSPPWRRALAQRGEIGELRRWWSDEGTAGAARVLMPALLAGLERTLGVSAEDRRECAEWVSDLAERSDCPVELRAAAQALAARACLRAGAVDEADERRALALRLVGRGLGAPCNELDWDCRWTHARVRAWLVAEWWPRYIDAGTARAWLDPERGFDAGDTDRATELALAQWVDLAGGELVTPRPTAPFPFVIDSLSAQVPPVAVTEAFALAGRGSVAQALSLLDDAAGGLNRSTARAGVASQAIERARLVLVRRFRLRDIGVGLKTTLSSSTHDEDLELIGVLDTLAGTRAGLPAPYRVPGAVLATNPALRHIAWRCTRHDDFEARRIADGWGGPPDLDRTAMGTVSAEQLEDVLDQVERRWVDGEDAVVPQAEVAAWLSAGDRHPRQVLRISLRVRALTGSPALFTRDFADACVRVGTRATAEMALDEGELLGLRLPGPARVLLRLAAQRFASVEDRFGALRSVAALASLDRREGRPVDVGAVTDALAAVRLPVRVPELFDDPTRAIQRFDLPELRPLLARLAWAVQTPGSPQDYDLRRVLEDLLGSTGPDGRIVLAAELDSEASIRDAVGGPPSRAMQRIVLRVADRGGNAWLRRGPTPVVMETLDGHRDTFDVAGFDEPPPASLWWSGPPALDLAGDLTPEAQLLAQAFEFVERDALVEVHPDLELAAVNWEGPLFATGAGSVYRRIRGAVRARFVDVGSRRVRVHGTRMVAEVWPRSSVAFARHVEFGDADPGHIAHFVGSIFERSRGLQLVLGDMVDLRSWLSPESCLDDLPTVVVIQPPAPSTGFVDSSTAERASFFRHFGGELFQAGAPVVIVVPPPTNIDRLRPLGRLAEAGRLTADLVLDVTAELRRNQPEPSDVTLYLSDTLPGDDSGTR